MTLEVIGIITGDDRSYVFLFNDDNTKFSNTHEWCRKNIEPHISDLKQASIEKFPLLVGKILNCEHIHIDKVKNMTEINFAEKELFLSLSMQSIIMVPLVFKNKGV